MRKNETMRLWAVTGTSRFFDGWRRQQRAQRKIQDQQKKHVFVYRHVYCHVNMTRRLIGKIVDAFRLSSQMRNNLCKPQNSGQTNISAA